MEFLGANLKFCGLSSAANITCLWTVINSLSDKFYAVVSRQNYHCYPGMAHSCIVLIGFVPTMTLSSYHAQLTSLLWHTATYQGLSKVVFSSSFLSSQSELSIPKRWPLIGRKVKAKEKPTTEGRTCLNTGLVFTNDIECLLGCPGNDLEKNKNRQNQVFLCSSIARASSISSTFVPYQNKFCGVVRINLWQQTFCQHSFHG